MLVITEVKGSDKIRKPLKVWETVHNSDFDMMDFLAGSMALWSKSSLKYLNSTRANQWRSQ